MKNLTWMAPLFALALWAAGCTEGAGVTGSCSENEPPTPPCGNGTIDDGEVCDPGNFNMGLNMNLGTASCSSLGMDPGTLSCNCRCQYDMTRCGEDNGVGGAMSGGQQ